MANKIGELGGYQFFIPTSGGKAGTGCNKTSTIQVRHNTAVKAQFRFTVDDANSRLSAIRKAKRFAIDNPLPQEVYTIKFTAEPWVLSTAADIVAMGLAHEDELAIIDASGQVVIAGVWPQGDDEAGREIQKANGHLLTAAPDLFKSLEALCRELKTAWDARILPAECFTPKAIQDARAALKKAVGANT